MSDEPKNSPQPASEIILYQTEDGRSRIEVRLDNETVWLTQQLMAELFQTTKQNISLHLQNIYAEGELTREATIKESSPPKRDDLNAFVNRLKYSILKLNSNWPDVLFLRRLVIR